MMKLLVRCYTLLLCFIALNSFGQDIQNSNALIRFHSYGSAASLNGITSPAPQEGSIAYRSDLGQVVFYNGSTWNQLGSGSGSTLTPWGLTGNAISGSASNFIGTTDNSEFHIRANNTKKLLIMPGPTGRHRVLFPKVVYFPNSGLNNSAVLGINGNQGRLRITAGSDDTFDNSQGACIDLHGNNAAPAFAGRLDLVAGSSNYYEAPDIAFWIGAAAPTIAIHSAYGANSFCINFPTPPPPSIIFAVFGETVKPGNSFWTIQSDRRVKKNITPYKKGLEDILKINTVSYQYNEQSKIPDLEQSYVGIIAQEMEDVLPTTVTIVNDSLGTGIEDLRIFNGSEILYTLINAVQELNHKSMDLEKENAKDREKIEKLKKSLNK